MKMSEAILLGSTVLAPKAGGQHFAEMKAGCALGMAAIAKGCTFRPIIHFDSKERRTLGTEGVWGNWVLEEVNRPCKCWRVLVPRKMRIKDIIAHLFDHHVMGKKNWTLEQLVAWVETVEPNDPAPPSRERTVHPSEVVSICSEFTRQQLRATQAYEEEDEEWQAVCQAFTAKHDANRRRGRPVPR
jgi:hypothetical protein